MNKHSEIILEDRNIFGLNKVHKNVLRTPAKDFHATKARVVHTSAAIDEEDVEVNENLLEFVSDGFKFDPAVVRAKARHALPYDPGEINEILENKNDLGNDILLLKRTRSVVLSKYQNNNVNRLRSVKEPDESANQQMLAIESGSVSDYSALDTELALVKFQPKVYFANKTSDESADAPGDELELKDEDGVEGVFLTEAEPEKVGVKRPVLNENALELQSVERTVVKWDDHLIDQLSENTARWIAVKNTADSRQKKKLVELVEEKFGKYTHRDVKDLDLVGWFWDGLEGTIEK